MRTLLCTVGRVLAVIGTTLAGVAAGTIVIYPFQTPTLAFIGSVAVAILGTSTYIAHECERAMVKP